MTCAYVVHPARPPRSASDGEPRRSEETRLTEALELTAALGVEVAGGAIIPVNQPRAATLLGGGAIETLSEKVAAEEIGLLIVNAQLTPVQQRNLENALSLKVLDRTGLILEIFGDRARTREGALQVALAHLEYQRSRLVRSWTHLERQRGGVGFMGGPGERQIESDRRILADKIVRLRRRLDKVAQTRSLHRASRASLSYPTVALVGYTNAGKSTLFNRLTEAKVLAQDMLFATLDPTMRAVALPSGGQAILSDTVGFIADLPTELVAAFRATLEEVLAADLIVHVRDVADPDSDAQRVDVLAVLGEIGVDEAAQGAIVEARNKIDKLEPFERQAAENAAARDESAVCVSALTGEGLDALLREIERRLSAAAQEYDIVLSADSGEALAWLYQRGCVRQRRDAENRIELTARMSALQLGQFRKRFGVEPSPPAAAAAQ